MVDICFDQSPLMTQPRGHQAPFVPQLVELVTTHVLQLHPLPIRTDPLVGTELGCVARRVFEVNSLSPT